MVSISNGFLLFLLQSSLQLIPELLLITWHQIFHLAVFRCHRLVKFSDFPMIKAYISFSISIFLPFSMSMTVSLSVNIAIYSIKCTCRSCPLLTQPASFSPLPLQYRFLIGWSPSDSSVLRSWAAWSDLYAPSHWISLSLVHLWVGLFHLVENQFSPFKKMRHIFNTQTGR